MSSSPLNPKDSSGGSMLIPVFGAVALIIAAAMYIVFKFTQQTAAQKWADYDECGWS